MTRGKHSALPLPLGERVGVRGIGTLGHCNPSPGALCAPTSPNGRGKALRRRFLALLPLLFCLVCAPAFAQSCPEPLASARRLVLVTAPNTSTTSATLARFERVAPSQPWRAVGAPEPALIGRNGMGWAQAFRALAQRGEPIKAEGDKRVPAGFYKIGGSFGFSPSNRPGHLHIREGTVCVHDPSSAAYNTITTREKIGALVGGENMWRVPAYRHGLLIDYPTDRSNRGGSCIFIHLRLPSAIGTAGCVALPEPQLLALQEFSEPGAVLAVLPDEARSRFGACLPR
jgi:L,D-peptidoglycan transpeptidase YkuD (ErfK/YbiS/YcfS/YnhG family)